MRNKVNLLYLLILISSIAYGATQKAIIMIIPLCLAIFFYLITFLKEKKEVDLIFMLLLAVIIPNNYIIILVSLIVYLLSFLNKRKRNCSKKIYLYLFFVYLILNLLLNQLRIENILFAAIYSLPLFTGALLARKIKIDNNDKEKICDFCIFIYITQMLSVISMILFNLNEFINRPDGDMISGTFGYKQGNVFAFFLAFSFIFLIQNNISKRKRIFLAISSIILLILTGSIMLIVAFFISYLIYIIFYKKQSLVSFFKYTAIIVLSTTLFFSVTPEWAIKLSYKIIKNNNVTQDIGKIRGMKYVFIDIPKEDFNNLFIGEGIGQYSSRAALTCTGKYIDNYNKYFKENISPKTRKYILPQLSSKNIGLISLKDRYHSTIISVMGEYGLIGIIFLILFFKYIFKNAKNEAKIFVIMIILGCFLDNFLEFANITTLLFIIEILFNNYESQKIQISN